MYTFTTSNHTITVREALEADAPAMTQCTRRNLLKSPYLLTHPEDFNPTVEQTQSWIQFHREKDNCVLMIAECARKVIAVQNLTGKQARKVRHRADYGVAILKEWRGMGIGKILLEVMIDWARKNSVIELMQLEVYAENQVARSMYRQAGFVEDGYQKNAFKNDEGIYFDNVLMTLYVGS